MSNLVNSQTSGFFQNHPSIIDFLSEEHVSASIYDDPSSKTLFFGTGLATRSAASQGLPIDFISYMLTAEELRRHFGLKQIVHVIADVHALANDFMDQDYVDQLAAREKQQIEHAVTQMGLDDTYVVQLASEYKENPEFQKIREDAMSRITDLPIPDDAIEYVTEQMADMRYFSEVHGATMKLSWVLDPKAARSSKGFDEIAFDRTYRDLYGNDSLSMAYTNPGLTADSSRHRVSPYTFTEGEARVLLAPEFDVQGFLESTIRQVQEGTKGQKRAAEKTLAGMQAIVEQFESVVGPLGGHDLENKITEIVSNYFTPESLQPTPQMRKDFDNVALSQDVKLSSNEHELSAMAEIIEPAGGLKEKLAHKRPLRVKLGFDPTAPDLHLGHAVVLNKMREFQDAGHQIVIIIGDYTARIGDPTGRNDTRPLLSEEEIKANARTYTDQLSLVLDMDKVEVRMNSEWFDRKNLADIIKLMGTTTLAQLMKRDSFKKRYADETPIHMHEMLYPLMQGTDSIEIDADIEMGGTDQLFNNMMGRHLQQSAGKEGQIVMCMPILPGLDGVHKMSKSKHNYIGLTEAPEMMFGKVMSITDEMMPVYIDLVVTPDTKEALREALSSDDANPMEVKLLIASNVVEQYHSTDAAKLARDHFDRNVRSKDVSTKDARSISVDEIAQGQDSFSVIDLAQAMKPDQSKSETRRQIVAGAFRVDGEKIMDVDFRLDANGIDLTVQFGKRNIATLERQAENDNGSSHELGKEQGSAPGAKPF